MIDAGTWSSLSNATAWSGQNGTRIAGVCAAGGTAVDIYGTGIYSDDSSICTAGVHSGRIRFLTGGPLVVEIRPGEAAYVGTTAYGVTSLDWGSWTGSYVFVP